MAEHFTNENYLDSKNHKLQSSNRFELEENIINADPNVIPNGFNQNNKLNFNVNTDNESEQELNYESNNEELNYVPNESNNLISEELSNNSPQISPSESNNNEKEENTPLTNYLNEVAGADKNKQDRKNIQELKNLSKLSEKERNNYIIGNELMEIFPISLIIAFIIFILLLIYVLGFKG